MQIKSEFTYRGMFPSTWDTDTVKNEPMLFNCSGEAAYELGGPITRAFLDRLPADWRESKFVVDSRVHMLMTGWYPCIPGYHHDDVPRSTATGQPNYIDPEYHSEHLLGLVNGDICPTEFVVGEIDLEIPSGIVYKEWHPQVAAAVESGQLKSVPAASGLYLQFNAHTFHQGTAAVGSGWRWFIRLSRNTNRVPTNELRRQVQVYLEHPMEGW